MLGKVKKRVSRVGLQPVKLHFSVQSQAISFPSDCLVADQAILSVSLERKRKTVATGSFVYRKVANGIYEMTLPKENLEMVAILYRDLRSGRFQKKSASLVLRELVKKGVLGQFSYNVIARCYLNLHEVANELGCKTTAVGRGIVRFDNLKGVVLKFTVTVTVQSVDHDCQYLGNEDAASEMSEVSNVSELTPDVLNDGFPCSVPVFESMPPPVGSYLDSTCAGLTRMPESLEEEEGSPQGQKLCSSEEDNVEATSTSHHTTGSSSSTGSAKFPPNSIPGTDFAAIEEMFAMYDEELKRRGEHVALLERRLAEQSAQFSTTAAAQLVEIATLRTRGVEPAADCSNGSSKNPFGEDCQPFLDTVQEQETLTARIAQLTVELQQSHDHTTFLRQALEEEMNMAREAAAVAANNAVLRAEVEDEYHALLQELITTKMEKANLSMQVDALAHENHTLSVELQLAQNEASDGTDVQAVDAAPLKN